MKKILPSIIVITLLLSLCVVFSSCNNSNEIVEDTKETNYTEGPNIVESKSEIVDKEADDTGNFNVIDPEPEIVEIETNPWGDAGESDTGKWTKQY